MPYKIHRQPTFTSADPYQLPEGTAIDLRASGIGVDDYFYVRGIHDNADPVLIMFTPEGRVSRVMFSRNPNENILFDSPVVDNIFLLVGRREMAPPPRVNDDPTLNAGEINLAGTDEARQRLREPINWLRPESRWVVVGAQTGRIVTVENAFVDLAGTVERYRVSPNPLGQPPAAERSEPMRNAQIFEARQFTREMAQLGGR